MKRILALRVAARQCRRLRHALAQLVERVRAATFGNARVLRAAEDDDAVDGTVSQRGARKTLLERQDHPGAERPETADHEEDRGGNHQPRPTRW